MWLTNQFRPSVLSSCRENNHTSPCGFNEPPQLPLTSNERLAVTAADAQWGERERASAQTARGLRSVETAFVSVLPEDLPLRLPPLSAHRTYGQPREKDDAHLWCGDFLVKRRTRESDRTDPAVRSSRRENLGESASRWEWTEKLREYKKRWESEELMRNYSSPVLHGPAGISDWLRSDSLQASYLVDLATFFIIDKSAVYTCPT